MTAEQEMGQASPTDVPALGPARIVVHDYSGHPFQVQLSRELARRGHRVWHLTSADFQTPKGRLDTDADLGDRLTVRRLSLGEVFQKNSFLRRRSQEIAFGRLVGREILGIKPDVVLSSNSPIDTQSQILRAARQVGARFVFWVQDFWGLAIDNILSARFGLPGRLVGRYYRNMEFGMLRASDAVVAISEDFVPTLTDNGVPPGRVAVIENWAPLEENPYQGPRDKAAGAPVRVIYAGTLGYKHNPQLLVRAAELPGVEVAVYSEGQVADELRARSAGLPSLSVHDWVAAEELPGTLASGDILTAIINADAGVYSVPSKLLTYLCAGRPIAACMPLDNLGARILQRSGAGLVTGPEDVDGFLANITSLVADARLRETMGEAGRRYAMDTFRIAQITDRFETIMRPPATR